MGLLVYGDPSAPRRPLRIVLDPINHTIAYDIVNIHSFDQIKRDQQMRAAARREMKRTRARGLQITAAARELRERIHACALKLRTRHPYNRARHSTSWLITAIAADLQLPPETVRGHLRILKQK